MSKWRVDFCKDLSHFATQTELSEKYDKIQANGEIMKQFGEESKRKWQWPKAYEAAAQPVSSIEDEQIDEGHVYDINEKHGLVSAGDTRSTANPSSCIIRSKLWLCSLTRLVWPQYNKAWMIYGKIGRASLDHSIQESSLRASHRSCQRLMQMVTRDEVPKMKSRLQEAADHRNKRDAAVLDAETKYQQMDPQQLIALLQLDRQAARVKTGGSWAKKGTICKGSELAGLVKQFPDLETFFDILLTRFQRRPAEHHQDPNHAKEEPQRLSLATAAVHRTHGPAQSRRDHQAKAAHRPSQHVLPGLPVGDQQARNAKKATARATTRAASHTAKAMAKAKETARARRATMASRRKCLGEEALDSMGLPNILRSSAVDGNAEATGSQTRKPLTSSSFASVGPSKRQRAICRPGSLAILFMSACLPIFTFSAMSCSTSTKVAGSIWISGSVPYLM